jgi:uncharacterized protein
MGHRRPTRNPLTGAAIRTASDAPEVSLPVVAEPAERTAATLPAMTTSSVGVYVAPTANTGKAVFAGRTYRRGDLILVIAGPISSRFTRYTVPIDERLAIDPLAVDNFSAYLNHSCEPNAGIRNRTLVVALRDVARGEEVTIDYAMIVGEYGNETTEEELACRCGGQACRGRLGAYDRLPADLRRRYRGYISEWLLER